MTTLPHIQSGSDSTGRAWVQVDDTELCDYVEDVLLEQFGLEPLQIHVSEVANGPSRYTMTFPGQSMPRILDALSTLDPERVHEIFLLNNPD